jgi:Putative zinc-finger/Predicted integral membrane protein (DUF2275)
MNCDEIQTRLSEYMEKSLDAISMKGIEVHLASCSRCRVEADSLAECIHQVSGLPLVDLPLGFSQRVMAHVREIDEKPPLWERLFFPLRVKIPLQATAVVLIGALAVVLSQKEEQLKSPPSSELAAPTMTLSAPLEQKIEQQKESTIVVERSIRNEQPAKSTVKPFADFAKQGAEQLHANKAATAPATVEQTPPASPSAGKADGESRSEDKDKREAPRRPAIKAQEVSTSGEAARSRSDTFGLGAAAGALSGEAARSRSDTFDTFGLGVPAGALRQPSLRSAPFTTERFLSPLSERSADVEFVVRRRPAERRDEKDPASGEALRKHAEASTTTPTSTLQRAAPSTVPHSSFIREIRWFTVPVDRFDQFKKELAAEASIESERLLGVLENDLGQKTGRELLIKVTIVSPVEG